jgi:hypothetical protein
MDEPTFRRDLSGVQAALSGEPFRLVLDFRPIHKMSGCSGFVAVSSGGFRLTQLDHIKMTGEVSVPQRCGQQDDRLA